MKTHCNQKTFEFQVENSRKIVAHFNGGNISSDSGGILLQQAERITGIIAQFAACFTDHRAPDLTEHTVEELIAQRVYALALGYEDLNDQLRSDSLLAVMVGKKDPTGKDRIRKRDSIAAQGPLNGVHCYLGSGSNWGNQAGALIISDAPLATVQSDLTYTLSMMTIGGVTPVVLDLLADGVALTPSSSISPPHVPGEWREFSRTYDATSLSGHAGESLTILLGHGRPATGTQDRYDGVSLTYVPEPATITLLGLGGLALLRRKRR